MNKKLGISVGIVVIVAILAGFFLGQMTARIEPAVKGGIAGAIVSFVFLYFLHDKNFRREKRRELVEKKLEKLYSPLHFNIEIIKASVGESKLGYKKKTNEESSRMKTFLDQIIEQNSYLASKELQQLLPKMHGVGFSNLTEEDVEKIIELVEKGYNELLREYNKFLNE